MQIIKRTGRETTPSQALGIHGQSSRRSTLCPRFFIILGFTEGKNKENLLMLGPT